MEGARYFDPVMVKRLKIDEDLRLALMEMATTPLSLKQQARFAVDHFVRSDALKVSELELPTVLESYLLFQWS